MIGLPINNRFQNLSKLGVITVPFGGQTAFEKFHPAVDVANVKGTRINTPVSGKVIDAVGGKKQGDEGFGNTVTIQDAQGNKHQLNHLNRVLVKKGQKVEEGQTPVGEMGNSGSAYSPSGQGDGTHLDYRIVSAFGKYKNPMIYLGNLNSSQ